MAPPAILWVALVAYAPCAVRRRAPGEPLVVAMRDGEPVPLRLPAGAALPANLTAALGKSSVALVEQPAPSALQPAALARPRAPWLALAELTNVSGGGACREASLWEGVPPCSGHGCCELGRCACGEGWMGPVCSTPAAYAVVEWLCPANCTGRGACRRGGMHQTVTLQKGQRG